MVYLLVHKRPIIPFVILNISGAYKRFSVCLDCDGHHYCTEAHEAMRERERERKYVQVDNDKHPS